MKYLAAVLRPLLALLLFGALASGCDSPTTIDAVGSVTVSAPPESVLVVGESMQLTAVVRSTAGESLTGQTIVWTSSDPSIAEVGASGLVTARSPGPVTITARTGGQAGELSLTVRPVPVASVLLSPDSVTLQVGEARTLVATVRDAAGNVLLGRTVEWSSGNEAIARVSQDGSVTALAPGPVVITAQSEDRSGTAQVTVLGSPSGPLPAPAEVRVERRSRLRARVSWAGVEGAAEYRVERRAAGGDWTALETTALLEFTDETRRARGGRYEYRVTAINGEAHSAPSSIVSTVVPAIRLAMIGDSNLQNGKDGTRTVATSYLEGGTLSIDVDSYPDHPKLLSGKVMALRADVEAVNHGISSTQTGTGTVSGRPYALHSIEGVTRFEAEILGRGYPWTATGIARTNAFAPITSDFGYYSLGVNDIWARVRPETIRDNIGTAIDLWLDAGLPAAHLMVTTIGPRVGNQYADRIPLANALIRELVAAKGVSLVDIAALVSDDDGLTWKDPDMQTGDGLHYSEIVNDLIAAEIQAVISRLAP
jgi:hypothetical protein